MKKKLEALMLADERTLEALDFATRARAGRRRQRARSAGKARAAQLEPAVDFALVRRRTSDAPSRMRKLVAGSDLHVLPAIEPTS